VSVRCLLRFVVVCLTALAAATPAAAAGIGGGPWSKPVSGPVVRSFDPPATRFGPGHLGVDFAAAPASPVRAAGTGVVVFAGRVGAALHVVVRHQGDLRTSYSFLASVDVVNGQRVERGATVGTSGGTGSGHDGEALHLGVRVGADYVDPMLLFEPVDLAAVVHLAAPRHGAAARGSTGTDPARVGERAALVDALRADARSPLPPPTWWRSASAGRPPPRSSPARASARERAHRRLLRAHGFSGR